MKNIIVFVFLLISLLFFNLRFINAETPGNKAGEKIVCLYKIWCYNNAKDNPDFKQIGQCTQKQEHRVRLTSREDSKSAPKSETYILECINHNIPTQTQPVITCTTGNSTLDRKLFCNETDLNSSKCDQADHYKYLQNLIDYNLDHDVTYGIFNVDKQPYKKMLPPQTVTTDEIGSIPTIEWQSYTPKGYERKFYAINILTAEQNKNTGGLGQKLANALTVDGNSQTCASVAWDPDGRVFDAVTLEPIPYADVNLLKKYENTYRDARETELGINNPFKTDSDGGFTFIVNDGNYKLNPVALNYTFPVDSLDKISANYKNIYSNIYPAQSGEEIIQKGELQHRDIPLMPNKSSGYTYDLKVLSFFNDLNKLSGQIILEGKVSHPLAKINIFSLKNNNNVFTRSRNIFTGQADKLGKFNIKLNSLILTAGEIYGDIEFEKVDLTGKSQFIGKTTAFQFDSIPNYLEGFAYDNYGNKLTNVNVDIYTNTSSKSYFQTTTDVAGFYKITSEYLPSMPYKIKYSSSVIQSINITPNQFIIKNSKYLAVNNINLSTFKAPTETAKITRIPKVNPTDNFAREKIGANNDGSANQGSQNSNSSLILIIAVILLLIGGVGAMLGIYSLHKKQTPTI